MGAARPGVRSNLIIGQSTAVPTTAWAISHASATPFKPTRSTRMTASGSSNAARPA